MNKKRIRDTVDGRFISKKRAKRLSKKRTVVEKTPGAAIDRATMAKAFNAWMKDYIDHPDKFKRDWQAVFEFLAEQKRGKKPTYGEVCTALLHQYAKAIR